MSEKKSIFDINERRKKIWPPTIFTRGGGSGGGEDGLATVKAAAWAWYQRNEGKPMIREFDLTTRATRIPRPSRYKLEASKNMFLLENWDIKCYTNHLSSGDQETKLSSLLDPYGIERISKKIHEGSLPINRVSLSGHDNDYVSLQMKTECDSKKGKGLVTKMSKKNLWKGVFMAPKTVCGRHDDVDLGAYRAGPKTVKVAPRSADVRTGRR